MIKNKFETFNMLPAIIHNGEFPNKQNKNTFQVYQFLEKENQNFLK